jgi:hypothetical protein
MNGKHHSAVSLGLLSTMSFLLDLKNALATFQSFMNNIFSDIWDEFVVVYLNNILIYSDNPKKDDDHVCLFWTASFHMV